MNVKALTNQYWQLTPLERFKLIVAAGSRDGEIEGNRLMSAGEQLRFVMKDYSPYAHAFQDVLLMTHIELLADAALVHECHAALESAFHASVCRPRRRKTAITPNNVPPERKTGKGPFGVEPDE
jgi:hypothetical protein